MGGGGDGWGSSVVPKRNASTVGQVSSPCFSLCRTQNEYLGRLGCVKLTAQALTVMGDPDYVQLSMPRSVTLVYRVLDWIANIIL